MSPYPEGSNLNLAIKPGDHLAVLLEDNRLTQKEFAKRTGVSIKYIRDLISGKVQLTAEAAIRFEGVLEFSADLWMRIEMLYQLRLAYEADHKATRKKTNRTKRSTPAPIAVVQSESPLEQSRPGM